MKETNWNIFKNLLLYTFVVLIGLLLYKLQSLVLLFFAGFILTSAIDPVVERLSRRIPRKIALLVVGISLFLVILLFFIPFINVLIQQILLFLDKAPAYWQGIQAYSPTAQKYLQGTGLLPDTSQIMAMASTLGRNIITSSIGLTSNFLAGIAFLATTITVTLYMLLDKSFLLEKLLKFFPPKTREKTCEVFGIISKKVGGYVISQIIIIFVLGLLISIGLTLLGVEFSLILGSLAAVLELIPIVGPIIAAATIILVALAQKPILAVWALILYAVAEWLTDTFIRPFVFGKFLEIHPLTMISALFAGAMLFGVPGLILAPAGAAVLSVLLDEFYIKKIGVE